MAISLILFYGSPNAHNDRVRYYKTLQLLTPDPIKCGLRLSRHNGDERLLRTGAAKISVSGLKRQDNGLVVTESA